MFKQHKAFTLAEVLITLGILGVVAAITIPVLNKQAQDVEYKTAYKKAFSDTSQVFSQAIQEQSLTPRTGVWNDLAATTSEWNALKNGLKITKECATTDLYSCWVDSDRVCTGACGGNRPINNATCSSFIDSAGRSWALYAGNQNIFLVDTNGFKEPKKFGKDRWMFTLFDEKNTSITNGFPAKVGIYQGADQTVQTDWCNYPPCYYKSWLFN